MITGAALITFEMIKCHVRAAGFSGASFAGDAVFDGVSFAGDAEFRRRVVQRQLSRRARARRNTGSPAAVFPADERKVR
jgi:hypothetical protein